MNVLTDQLIDETYDECVERAQRLEVMQFRPAPPDHDAHVMSWRIAMWDEIEERAWLKRQEKALSEGC